MDRRSYRQYCGIARALDVVGERWTLLIVRNLLLGPLRYSELQRGLPGITTNLLARRLREMEGLGLIERIRHTAADSGHAYRLTTRGAALEPALRALAQWGAGMLARPGRDDRVDVEWLLVALRWVYRGGASLNAEVVADGVPYRVSLHGDAAEIARGQAPAPEVRIRGSGAAVARLFLEPADRRGRGAGGPRGLEVHGTPEAVRTLLGAFVLSDLAVGRPGAVTRGQP